MSNIFVDFGEGPCQGRVSYSAKDGTSFRCSCAEFNAQSIGFGCRQGCDDFQRRVLAHAPR